MIGQLPITPVLLATVQAGELPLYKVLLNVHPPRSLLEWWEDGKTLPIRPQMGVHKTHLCAQTSRGCPQILSWCAQYSNGCTQNLSWCAPTSSGCTQTSSGCTQNLKWVRTNLMRVCKSYMFLCKKLKVTLHTKYTWMQTNYSKMVALFYLINSPE